MEIQKRIRIRNKFVFNEDYATEDDTSHTNLNGKYLFCGSPAAAKAPYAIPVLTLKSPISPRKRDSYVRLRDIGPFLNGQTSIASDSVPKSPKLKQTKNSNAKQSGLVLKFKNLIGQRTKPKRRKKVISESASVAVATKTHRVVLDQGVTQSWEVSPVKDSNASVPVGKQKSSSKRTVPNLQITTHEKRIAPSFEQPVLAASGPFYKRHHRIAEVTDVDSNETSATSYPISEHSPEESIVLPSDTLMLPTNESLNNSTWQVHSSDSRTGFSQAVAGYSRDKDMLGGIPWSCGITQSTSDLVELTDTATYDISSQSSQSVGKDHLSGLNQSVSLSYAYKGDKSTYLANGEVGYSQYSEEYQPQSNQYWESPNFDPFAALFMPGSALAPYQEFNGYPQGHSQFTVMPDTTHNLSHSVATDATTSIATLQASNSAIQRPSEEIQLYDIDNADDEISDDSGHAEQIISNGDAASNETVPQPQRDSDFWDGISPASSDVDTEEDEECSDKATKIKRKPKPKKCPICGQVCTSNFSRHLKKHKANTEYAALKAKYGVREANRILLNRGRRMLNEALVKGSDGAKLLTMSNGKTFALEKPITGRTGQDSNKLVPCPVCDILIHKRSLPRHRLTSRACKIKTAEQNTPDTGSISNNRKQSLDENYRWNVTRFQYADRRAVIQNDDLVYRFCIATNRGYLNTTQKRTRFQRRCNLIAEFLVAFKTAFEIPHDAQVEWHKLLVPANKDKVLQIIQSLCKYVEKEDLQGDLDYYEKGDKVKHMVPKLEQFMEFIYDDLLGPVPEADLAPMASLKLLLGRDYFRDQTTGKVAQKKLEKPPKPRKPPSSEDIRLTLEGLVAMTQAYEELLEEHKELAESGSVKKSDALFRKLYTGFAEALAILVIMYNGRRKFEVLKMEFDDLKAAQWDINDPDCLKTFTSSQLQIKKDILCVFTVGKSYAPVPTLLTKWMHEKVQVMLSYRSDAGVSANNKFIFASPSPFSSTQSFQYVPCTKVLKDIKTVIQLADPNTVSTRGARCHVAVLSAQVALTENDKDLIQKFLSHSDPVHQLHYKIIKGDLFKAKMSPLLEARMGCPMGDFENMSFSDMAVEMAAAKNRSSHTPPFE